MRPIYKKVSIAMPHCPECKEQLRGNNSIAMPWKCSCGTWTASYGEDGFSGEYEILSTPVSEKNLNDPEHHPLCVCNVEVSVEEGEHFCMVNRIIRNTTIENCPMNCG